MVPPPSLAPNPPEPLAEGDTVDVVVARVASEVVDQGARLSGRESALQRPLDLHLEVDGPQKRPEPELPNIGSLFKLQCCKFQLSQHAFLVLVSVIIGNLLKLQPLLSMNIDQIVSHAPLNHTFRFLDPLSFAVEFFG